MSAGSLEGEAGGRVSTPDRAPSTSWSLRSDFRDNVMTLPDDGIQINVDGQFLITDRATARLLAKRINQCLDATAKR